MRSLQLRILARKLLGRHFQRVGRLVNGVRGFLWHRFRRIPPKNGRLWYGWGNRVLGLRQISKKSIARTARVFLVGEAVGETEIFEILDQEVPGGVKVFVATGSWHHWTKIRDDRLIFINTTGSLKSVYSEIRQRLRQYVDPGSSEESLEILEWGLGSSLGEKMSRNLVLDVPNARQSSLRSSGGGFGGPGSLTGPVNIVDHTPAGTDWIVGRIGLELAETLNHLGVEALFTSKPVEKAAVFHHLIYLSPWAPKVDSLHTTMVTHVDEGWKMATLEEKIRAGAIPIALSSETARLVGRELGDTTKGNIPFVPLPPMVESNVKPFAVGVFTRVYGDFRKRQFELIVFAKHFNPGEVRFTISGDGWDKQVQTLRRLGFEVEYHSEFSREVHIQLLDSVDAVVYFGWDDGVVGCLDALARGRVVVAPAVGFHLDYNCDNLLFSSNGSDAARVLRDYVASRTQLRNMLAKAKWSNYAESHLGIWDFALTANRRR